MKKTKWIMLNRLCIQHMRIQLCSCKKGMLFVNTLLPSGLKRVFFKQKARILWLSLGDQNTSYFHKSVNGRQNRNKLLSLIREDGEVVEGHETFKSEIIAYFHRVLGVDEMPRVLNEEVMESAINLKLSSTQQHVLAQDVTREKIKYAMFSLKNNKAQRSGWL